MKLLRVSLLRFWKNRVNHCCLSLSLAQRRGLLLLLVLLGQRFYQTYRFPLVPLYDDGLYDGFLKELSALDPNNNNYYYYYEDVQCVGWRQLYSNKTATATAIASSSKQQRRPLYDRSCHAPIPNNAAGYCELRAPNGTLIQAMNKSCRNHPKAKHLTCHMAKDFLQYKHQAHAFVQKQQKKKKNNNDSNSHTPPTSQKQRGIVICAYDDVLVSIYALIQLLRQRHHCSLPIQLWSLPLEIQTQQTLLSIILQQLPNVTHHILKQHDDALPLSSGSFFTKPLALYQTDLQQVLLLDADSIPIQDPTYLFDYISQDSHSNQYTSSSSSSSTAIFFPDYWHPYNTVFDLTSGSLVWELLGIPYVDEFEGESGQLVVDKTQSQRALHMLLFLTHTFDVWLGPLKLAYGDKDLFRFAWKMTQTPYTFVSHPPGTAGFGTDTVPVCGVTLVQHDPSGQSLFLHRNTVKIKGMDSLQKVWHKGMTFVGDKPLEEYIIQPSPVKGQKIKCYHPTKSTANWFQEKDFAGTNIERIEDDLLKYAKEAFLMRK